VPTGQLTVAEDLAGSGVSGRAANRAAAVSRRELRLPRKSSAPWAGGMPDSRFATGARGTDTAKTARDRCWRPSLFGIRYFSPQRPDPDTVAANELGACLSPDVAVELVRAAV
jgi:hypothetical protein